MGIDEKRLRELVIKAIELFESESSRQNLFISKKKLYVIFTEECSDEYLSFFEKLEKQNKYEVYAVVQSEKYDDVYLNNLKKFNVFKEIIDKNQVNLNELTEYVTIFPVVPREVIVKTALCIDDIFETKWIFKSMEKGQKIILLRSGLERFSGREPLSYINKILNYYRTLLEFNIEIIEDITQIEDGNSIIHENTNNNVVLKENKGKQVITEQEIENYKYDKKIILNPGDIITDLANDRARSLNIQIIKRN